MPKPTTPSAPITAGVTLVILAGGVAAFAPALSAILTALAGLLLVTLGGVQAYLEQRATASEVTTLQDRIGRLESRLSATESALNLGTRTDPREASFARRR